MAKVTIDGVVYELNPENNLLQECLSQGLDVPYFCWHPCMGSVGACRQCAVKQYRDENDTQGTIVMACMTPVSDGAILSVDDQQTKAFRAGVIESLMTSHPHDCPVCEEGGECHLQDMTQMSGHNYRRHDKKKVTHRNQDLGPFIGHEMNRCITCYRCVRYYDDYAGGTDLSAQASHHHTYFGRFEEGTLENEFSGNLVEVCPTGVFTDKTFSENYTRKWDLQVAPSVCVGCSVGCNITPGERYGTLRRVVNRYNDEINGYFICDRGRFGAHYVNSESRVRGARDASGLSIPVDDARVRLDAVIDEGNVIGIGSPRASNEANYALRSRVGVENFYSGHSDDEHEALEIIVSALRDESFHCPSIREIENADAVLVLGIDVTNAASRVALAVRQSVRNLSKDLAQESKIPVWQDSAVRELAQDKLSPLAIFSVGSTRLDDVATFKVNLAPDVLLKAAVRLDSVLSGQSADDGLVENELPIESLNHISEALLNAKNPLIICGTSAGVEMLRIATNMGRSLGAQRGAAVNLALLPTESNSVGHALMVREGNTLGKAFERIERESIKTAIILENDLYRRAPSANIVAAFELLENRVVFDHVETNTTKAATLLLPSTAFSEQEATSVNYEGRAQLSFQVNDCGTSAKTAWRWLFDEKSHSPEGVIKKCSEDMSDFAKLVDCLPKAGSLVAGMKVPRQSHRYSGRTAMSAQANVHEGKQAVDEDSVMSFSMEGVYPQKDASVLASPWAPSWTSNQSISKFQSEINGALKQGQSGVHLLSRSGKGSKYKIGAIEIVIQGLQVVPAQHIFGSEELSGHALPIQERMTDAYAAISPKTASTIGVQAGDFVRFKDSEICVEVCVRVLVPNDVVLVYAGNRAAGVHFNLRDIERVEILERVETAPAMSVSRSLGLGQLLVNDLYEERG